MAALVWSFRSIHTNRLHSGEVVATFAGGWLDWLPAKAFSIFEELRGTLAALVAAEALLAAEV
jgi:hypothetical protein